MGVAAMPPPVTETDERPEPCASQSSSQQQGRGDGEQPASPKKLSTDDKREWKSNDTSSTHNDLGSTDDESGSTDADSEDYEDESESASGSGSRRHSTVVVDAPDEAAVAQVVEPGFAYEEELARVGQDGLVTSLANVLTHLVSLGCKAHRATIFHAATPPQISVQDYLSRIAKYYQCSNGCLILGLIYIDRLVKLHPDFVVSSLNIHRLISTSVMLAAKFHDDVFYSNKYYGKVAGVRVSELNRLEEKFLQLLNWQLYVVPEEYDEYLGRVLLPSQVARSA